MRNQPTLPTEFGLLAWLESTRVALPLKGVECRFEVTGGVSAVELDQIYHQNTDRPLDCTYTFPLPAGAAVYRCELHVNGRVIRAKVEDREAACRIFKEQKAAGRRAALVESERENLFTLALGNVQPGDLIVIRFAWFQALDRTGDGLRLLVPTCPGVRYIPGEPLLRASSGSGTVDDTDQVPDASRITPPRISALHPDAAYFSLAGRMSALDVESGTVSSPSHPIFVRESDGTVSVALSGHDAVPDRDFVLAWREPQARQLAPQAWHWTEGAATYALVQLRAPEGVQVAAGFPQDFYFLVDRSSSMAGAKWEKSCEALRAFVGLLGAQDRVWITLFEDGHQDFAEAPLPAPAVLADPGFLRLRALGTGGGTNLLPAARHVLMKIAKHSAGRHTSVVLITDGQVGNDQEIVQVFQQVPKVRVHTFGIDTAVNDAFLRSLARQQRGGCWLQTPNDDIAGTVAALGDRLRRPVITDLAAQGAWEAGRTTWPDLHAHEVVALTLRGTAASPLEITGRLPDGRIHRFALQLTTAGSTAVKLLWAKERIDTLLAADRQPAALALAKEHNLICEGAAFIAWDEAEQVAIAEEVIVQPAMEHLQLSASVRHDSFCDPEAPTNWRRMSANDSEASDDLGFDRACLSPDPLPLDDELRSLFQTGGVPDATISAFLAWTTSDGSDGQERMRALRDPAQLLAFPRRADIPGTKLENLLQQALSDSPEALIQWGYAALIHLILGARDIPEPLIEHLIAWILESGTLDRIRLNKLKDFTASLNRSEDSPEATARLWQTFLKATVGADSEAYAIAMRWLQEVAKPAPARPFLARLFSRKS